MREESLIVIFQYQISSYVKEAGTSFDIHFLFYCFTDINDCIGVNCSGNGDCSDRVDGYICFCNSGFFGINCEVGKASHLIQ